MRTPTMIAIGGAVVLAGSWLLLSRTPPPAAPVPPRVVIAAPAHAVPPAENAAATTEPPAVVVPPPAPAPAAPPPATSTGSENKPEPAANGKPLETGESDADTAETPADDDVPADDASAPPPIDADHAADLMADWIARQEGEGADGDPDKVDHVSKTFDDESANGDAEWSESSEKKIEAVLDEWLAGLPEEIRQHLDLIRLECRVTLCQILAADNDPETMDEREQHAQEWQQAMALLPQQPWWHELGFVDMTTTIRSDGESGYLLYQTYLMREGPPAQQ